MPEESEPILEIDLQKKSGGKIIFNNLDEVESWLLAEQEYWKWVHQEINNWNSKAGPGGYGKLWGAVSGTW